MDREQESAGDDLPNGGVQIEVRVAELRQLFNAMDPSPFRDKDLDPNAEAFIVGWAREAPRDADLSLLVHLDRPAGPPSEQTSLRDAVHEFFAQRSQAARRRLRDLLRRGQISLLIGLFTLAGLMVLGDLIGEAMSGRRIGALLRESLLIGGWVAMWRPLEIFLYDWWPIHAEVRLAQRLSVMPVRIAYRGESRGDAWRSDWPAVPAWQKAAHEQSAPPSAANQS